MMTFGSKWMLNFYKLYLSLIVLTVTVLALVNHQFKHFFVSKATNKHYPKCPEESPYLVGPFQAKAVPLKEMARHFPALEPGGSWRPAHCAPFQRVAIIVPYRDRAQHLPVLLSTLHTMLPRQQLHYRIFVVEQSGKYRFNKGMLMNIGFLEALKLYDAECFIFHDVDLIPENDRNIYTCDKNPKHLAVAVDVFNYNLPYQTIFGGVVSMTKEVFLRVDGFSNLYWGWGAEDDDMYLRIKDAGLQITRYQHNFAKYRMLKHIKQNRSYKNLKKISFFFRSKRYRVLLRRKDGVKNLRYHVPKIVLAHAYTHIEVQLVLPI